MTRSETLRRAATVVGFAVLAVIFSAEARFEAETPEAPPDKVQFTDVTAPARINFKHVNGAFGKKYLPETMGSGAAFLDYDGDGWPDIFLVNSTSWPGHGAPTYPALYRNNHDGTFTDVTKAAGLAVEMYGIGAAAADY